MTTISSSTTSSTAYKVAADTSGTLILQTGSGPTTAVTIDGSQNVLVGTSTAVGKLTVYQSTSGDGTISIGNSQDVYTCNVGKQGVTAYGATSAGDAFLYTSTKNISIMADGGSSVIKFTAGGNAERARIDSSGNLLVGRSSSLGTGNVPNLEVGAGSWHVMSNAGTVNNAGTVAVYSGSNRFCGFLTVVSVYSANAATRTQATYSAFIVDGNADSIQQINTANGSGGGSAFTVAWTNGTGFVVTNTAGAQRTLYISATGTFQG
jgi:hypothetical protein